MKNSKGVNIIIIIVHKKERTCKIMDFVVPVDHRVKLKELRKEG